MAKAGDISHRTAIEASRSIYYSLTDEVPDLTVEERQKLESVMKKAMEFEEEEANKMRQLLEGQLYKYTNVVKGWQYRWFVVSPDTGMLEYYMLDDRKKNRPRGALYLSGAMVSSSDEDNLSFVVSDTCGEVYRLKASDAKERQIWVDKIHSVIERHANSTTPEIVKTLPSINSFALCKVPRDSQSSSEVTSLPKGKQSSIMQIRESVYKAVDCQKGLAKLIEDLPYTGSNLKCSDNRLLLVKALSQATVQSLEQCYLILRQQRQKEEKSVSPSVGLSMETLDKLKGSNMKRDIKK